MEQQATTVRGPVRVLTILLMLLTLVLSGCPSAQQTTSPKLSKQVFLMRLVGICAGVNQRLQQAGPTPSPALIARELTGFVDRARSGEVPAEDRSQFDKMLTALAGAATKQQALDAAQRSGSSAQADQAAAQAKTAFTSANAEAQRYGMPDLNECDKTMRQQARGNWTTLAEAPQAVQQVGTAVLNGVIWLVGGLTQGQATDNVMGYDSTIDTWTFGPPLPGPLHHAMAVAYRGELVVLGGFVPAGSQVTGTASDRVYRLKQGVQWEELPPLHHARAAGAATVVKDKIVVVGGRDTRQLVPVTEVFDGSAWRDARAIPVPGDHLAAVSNDSSVYAVGGRNLSADKNTAALQRYDVDTDRWTALMDMPTPRGGLGAALLKGSIIAVGGEAPTTAYDTVESYDLASGTWSVLPPTPEPRHGLAVATVGDRLFAACGAATAGHTGSSATMVAFQPVAASATPTTSAAAAMPAVTTSAGASTSTASTSTASTSTASTSTASTSTTQATIYDCPAQAPPLPWACLTHAAISSGGLTIAYTTNFTPSAVQDASHYHLHLFTANTKDGKSTDPSDSIMQESAGPREGSWFILYANGVSRIDADTARGGREAPLDLERFSLLCVRVATGMHELARGPSGGFDTGNCVLIHR